MGYHDLLASRPNALGSLRSAHGRKNGLSKYTSCSIFIRMIFKPFVISSGFLFSKIALFKMMCLTNSLALCAIARILFVQGRGSLDSLAGPLQDHPKISAISFHIAHSVRHIPRPHNSHKTFAHRRGWAHALLPCRNTAYLGGLKIIK